MRSVFRSDAGTSIVVTQSSLLSKFAELKHGISTRVGGVSPEPFGLNMSFSVGDAQGNVEENRRRFFSAVGVDAQRTAIPRQRHTSTIRLAVGPGDYEECDALITDVNGVYLSVSVADCAPIFIYDPDKRVLGCVHAGWRGAQKQIVSATVARMAKEYGSAPASLVAFIGPCAGSCCYEVGKDVASQFDEDCRSVRDGKIYLNIKKAIAAQLRSAWIPDSHVEVSEDCTICGTEYYHSFRRDRDKSGRMVAFIGMNR